ncbi:MAG: NYN domain-containing protein, partial [Cyanobacteriota bacterium]
MSDNANVTPAKDSAVVHQLSLCVYQAILEIQQQQPELLKEKYRTVSWQDARNRSTFLVKLKEGISNTQNQEALIRKVQSFLQMLLLPNYFELPCFDNLVNKIRSLTQQLAESNHAVSQDTALPLKSSLSPISAEFTQSDKGIAILLLDAENLQLDANTEKVLARMCTYPIQIKIAFANWRNMGKQDVEFHNRGYELIHVPAGKDSADVKMATVGSSIFVHYPTAKEVLVCSSDGVLTHLCTTLQTHGLTVYQVRRKGDIITVFNTQTQQTQTHSLKPISEIPPWEDFIKHLRALIQSEQKRTNIQWIKLARISALFQEKYNLSITQVMSHHFPGKRARDIFIDTPAIFSVHQLSEQSEIYINLFDASPVEPLVID